MNGQHSGAVVAAANLLRPPAIVGRLPAGAARLAAARPHLMPGLPRRLLHHEGGHEAAMPRLYRLDPLPPSDPEYVSDDIFGQVFFEFACRLTDRIIRTDRVWHELRSGALLLTVCVDRAERRWREIAGHEIATGLAPVEIASVNDGHGAAFGGLIFAARVRHVGWVPIAEAAVIYPPRESINSAEWIVDRIRRGLWEAATEQDGERTPAPQNGHFALRPAGAAPPEGSPVCAVRIVDPVRFVKEAAPNGRESDGEAAAMRGESPPAPSPNRAQYKKKRGPTYPTDTFDAEYRRVAADSRLWNGPTLRSHLIQWARTNVKNPKSPASFASVAWVDGQLSRLAGSKPQ